jgi:hypothetical protein
VAVAVHVRATVAGDGVVDDVGESAVAQATASQTALTHITANRLRIDIEPPEGEPGASAEIPSLRG